MRPLFFMLLLAVSATVHPIPGARGQGQYVLKMATTAAEGSPLVRQMQRLAAIIEQRTAGLILVKLFPEGRLGDDAALLSKLRAGALQIYGGDVDALADTVPAARVLSLPHLFADYAHADLRLDGPIKPPLRAALAEHGIVFGAWGPSVFQRWFSNRPAPRSPDGFDGWSVATQGSVTAQSMWRAMGASPVGELDLQENRAPWMFRSTAVVARATGKAAHATHVTRADASLNSQVIVLSKRWLAGLPARFQDAVRRLPQEPTTEARQHARAIDAELVRRMGERGHHLGALDDAARQAFASFGAELAEQASSEAGQHASSLWRAARE